MQLLGSLEECVEMAGEMEESCPQAGFIFEEMAEVRSLGSVRCFAYQLTRYSTTCMMGRENRGSLFLRPQPSFSLFASELVVRQ